MSKKVSTIIITLVVFHFLILIPGLNSSLQGAPPKGILYGNKLKPGWSAIYQWYKGAWGRTSYRRVIVAIKIKPGFAKVFFDNGSSRLFYNIAIINNVDTTAGTLKHWKIARNHPKDTLILKKGKIIHGIIKRYVDHTYLFKDRPAIHRDLIRIVYPNPSIPLARRL